MILLLSLSMISVLFHLILWGVFPWVWRAPISISSNLISTRWKLGKSPVQTTMEFPHCSPFSLALLVLVSSEPILIISSVVPWMPCRISALPAASWARLFPRDFRGLCLSLCWWLLFCKLVLFHRFCLHFNLSRKEDKSSSCYITVLVKFKPYLSWILII